MHRRGNVTTCKTRCRRSEGVEPPDGEIRVHARVAVETLLKFVFKKWTKPA